MEYKGKPIIIDNLPKSKSGQWYQDVVTGLIIPPYTIFKNEWLVEFEQHIKFKDEFEKELYSNQRSLTDEESSALDEAFKESLIDKPTLKGRK